MGVPSDFASSFFHEGPITNTLPVVYENGSDGEPRPPPFFAGTALFSFLPRGQSQRDVFVLHFVVRLSLHFSFPPPPLSPVPRRFLMRFFVVLMCFFPSVVVRTQKGFLFFQALDVATACFLIFIRVPFLFPLGAAGSFIAFPFDGGAAEDPSSPIPPRVVSKPEFSGWSYRCFFFSSGLRCWFSLPLSAPPSRFSLNFLFLLCSFLRLR